MTVAFVVVAALLAAASLLAIPVHVSFRLQGAEPIEGHVAIRWLFGLVRLRVPAADRRRRRRAAARAEQEAEVRAKPERRLRARALTVLGEAPFRRRAARLLADLARAVRVDELGLHVRLGLGDPADTGRLWAVVGPLSAAAETLRRADVRIEPELVEDVLEFDLRGKLLLVPLQLLALSLAFALSPPSIRAWRILWASRA